MSPTRLAAGLLAALLASSWALHAAPADDLKEAQRLYGQGKVQPAMEKVDTFLKAQPKDAQGRFLKGLLLTEQKRSAEAIQVFTGLTEDYPELPEPYNNLAVLYASQGNYDKAKSALELAIHTHPSYATAHENLGDIYAQLASRAYDRALQLDKNNATAQTKLSMVKELFVSQRPGAKGAPAPAKPEPLKQEPAPKAKPEVVAKVEPPKAAPVPATPAKPEPAKVEPPKAEPPTSRPKPEAAKVEPKPEPAKVEPKAAAPAKPEPAKVEPAKAATPAAAAGDEAAITASIVAWAKAWSAKDVKGYLAAYSPDFEVPGGEKRAAWEKQRAERIERPKSIDVDVKINSVKVSGNEATVNLRQSYKSDTLKTNSTKVMKLVKSGDRWLIKQERAGG